MSRVLALVSGGVLALAVLTGCGQKETSTSPEGKVTIERRGGKTEVTLESEDGTLELKGDRSQVTITTDEGTAVVEMGPEVTEEELGLPFYPGATVEHVMRQSTEGGEEYVQAHLTTSDGFADVTSFYKTELPQATIAGELDTEAIKTFRALLDEGEVKKAVMVSRDSSNQRTRIVLDKSVMEE
jgi:hypothetical protein